MGKRPVLFWVALCYCCLALGLTGCGAAAQAASPTAATRLQVVRSSPHATALDTTVTDPTQVARLRRAIDALAPVALDQPLNCPADTGTVYTLTFSQDGCSPEAMQFSASGCQLLTIKEGDDVRFTTEQFRSLLSQITGISPLDA
jgi:hypothetical protein